MTHAQGGATGIIFGTEEWVEFLSEGAASKGEVKMCIYIIKGDQTPLRDHKYSNFIRGDFRERSLNGLSLLIYHFPFLKDIVQKPF